METKNWPTNVLVTICGGRMACSIDEVYKFLDWFENQPHWTHELGDASLRVGPIVLDQHPELKLLIDLFALACKKDRIKSYEDVEVFFSGYKPKFSVTKPSTTPVERSAEEVIQSLVDKVGEDKVITVVH